MDIHALASGQGGIDLVENVERRRVGQGNAHVRDQEGVMLRLRIDLPKHLPVGEQTVEGRSRVDEDPDARFSQVPQLGDGRFVIGIARVFAGEEFAGNDSVGVFDWCLRHASDLILNSKINSTSLKLKKPCQLDSMATIFHHLALSHAAKRA